MLLLFQAELYINGGLIRSAKVEGGIPSQTKKKPLMIEFGDGEVHESKLHKIKF